MKTLGMIGGTSYHSTIDYYRYINDRVSKSIGSEQNPPLLLYSLNVSLMRRGDWEEIRQFYLNKARMLERENCDAVIFCANTPHKVYDFVSSKINIPILHIADAIGREAVENGFEQLILLGTRFTMQETFISDWLASNYSIKCLIPDEPKLLKLHELIAEEMTQGIFSAAAKEFTEEIIEELTTRGGQAAILGCTELPILLKGTSLKTPLLDTTYLHSNLAAEFILSEP